MASAPPEFCACGGRPDSMFGAGRLSEDELCRSGERDCGLGMIAGGGGRAGDPAHFGGGAGAGAGGAWASVSLFGADKLSDELDDPRRGARGCMTGTDGTATEMTAAAGGRGCMAATNAPRPPTAAACRGGCGSSSAGTDAPFAGWAAAPFVGGGADELLDGDESEPHIAATDGLKGGGAVARGLKGGGGGGAAATDGLKGDKGVPRRLKGGGSGGAAATGGSEGDGGAGVGADGLKGGGGGRAGVPGALNGETSRPPGANGGVG
jgi:hypothetical protein